MAFASVVVSLPIDDRRRSYEFYRRALGLVAVGEPADDGVPEPLQFQVTAGLRLMLVPRGGFGWVASPRPVAPVGHTECIVTVFADDEAAVDELIRRAEAAGAGVVMPPGQQPWGYAGTFADPDGHVWMVRGA